MITMQPRRISIYLQVLGLYHSFLIYAGGSDVWILHKPSPIPEWVRAVGISVPTDQAGKACWHGRGVIVRGRGMNV